jgi:hypothetical protein
LRNKRLSTALMLQRSEERAAECDRQIEDKAMQGKKTHEQQLCILENKDDVPDARRRGNPTIERPHIPARDERESEFPVSRGGVNQESGHNKHNDTGQSGHRPQQHISAEEK